MSWSWRIGRIAGIDVYIHFTFFLLLAWVGGSYYLESGQIAQAIAGVAFILGFVSKLIFDGGRVSAKLGG